MRPSLHAACQAHQASISRQLAHRDKDGSNAQLTCAWRGGGARAARVTTYACACSDVCLHLRSARLAGQHAFFTSHLLPAAQLCAPLGGGAQPARQPSARIMPLLLVEVRGHTVGVVGGHLFLMPQAWPGLPARTLHAGLLKHAGGHGIRGT